MTLEEIKTHVNLIMESQGSTQVYEDFNLYHDIWNAKFGPASYEDVKLQWPGIYSEPATAKPQRILNA